MSSGRRWDRLEQLFTAARREDPPHVDVRHAVIDRIANETAASLTDVSRALVWCTIGSVAAAGIVAIMASGAVIDLIDPLSELMQSCDVVLR